MRGGAAHELSRAELFAQETLGRDRESIGRYLRDCRVLIGIGRAPAGSRQGQIGLVTAVNILSRMGLLVPNIDLDVPSDARVLPGVPLLPRDQPLGESLISFMRHLVDFQGIEATRARADPRLRYECGLFIGDARFDVEHPVTIGASRWLAAVNPLGSPEDVDEGDSNPLGIILAAALGSAEVVKRLWLPLKDSAVVIEPMRQRTVMSALDGTVDTAEPPNPPFPPRCRLGHICIFGLGAIGSGCNYVLACLPDVHMSADFIDMDHISLSNEERLFTSADPEANSNQPKVVHARNFIESLHSGVRVSAVPSSFQRYVESARHRLSYVMCGLDSAPLRRVLQTELAGIVVNGATDLSRWMVSLHEYDRPENACLWDMYPGLPVEAILLGDDLAPHLRIREALIRRLAREGGRLDGAQLESVARELRDGRAERQAALGGTTPCDADAEPTCSRIRPSQVMPAATISFVSLLPAVFMVADLVKRRTYDWSPARGQPNVFCYDALRLPHQGQAANILASRDCFCQCPRYREAFRLRQFFRTAAPHARVP